MVEGIKEFSSEFRPEALGNGGILLKRNVPDLSARTNNAPPVRIAKGVLRGSGKTTGVKPHSQFSAAAAATANIWVANFVRITTPPAVEVVERQEDRAHREPTLKSRQTLNLPPANKLTLDASDAVGEVFPGAKRKRVNVTEGESVPGGKI